MRRGLRLALTAFLAFLPALGAYAHPHVFINSHVSVDFEGEAGVTCTRTGVAGTRLSSTKDKLPEHPDTLVATSMALAVMVLVNTLPGHT